MMSMEHFLAFVSENLGLWHIFCTAAQSPYFYAKSLLSEKNNFSPWSFIGKTWSKRIGGL